MLHTHRPAIRLGGAPLTMATPTPNPTKSIKTTRSTSGAQFGAPLENFRVPPANAPEKQELERLLEPTPAFEHLDTGFAADDAAAAADWPDIAEAAEADAGRLEGQLLMLCVALLWGSNFPAVKAVIGGGLEPSAAAAARFTVAAAALSPLLGRGEGKLPRELVVGGLECGLWLALGYGAQALALQSCPSTVVAFLASLQVVFVPLLLVAFGGEFTQRLGVAAALCVGGVAFLELGSDPQSLADGSTHFALSDGLGAPPPRRPPPPPRRPPRPALTPPLPLLPAGPAQLLAMLQPIGFGTSYIRIERLMEKYPDKGLQLSSLQLISNAAAACAWLAFTAATVPDALGDAAAALSQPPVAAGVLYTGLVSTALAVLLQTRALGKIPATDSSVIVATEPLWAAGFAALLLGENLPDEAKLGGALILLGCLANDKLPETLVAPKGDE